MVTLAHARSESVKLQADADRHMMEQIATGERAKVAAHAMGQQLLVESLNGDVASFVKLSMIKEGAYMSVYV